MSSAGGAPENTSRLQNRQDYQTAVDGAGLFTTPPSRPGKLGRGDGAKPGTRHCLAHGGACRVFFTPPQPAPGPAGSIPALVTWDATGSPGYRVPRASRVHASRIPALTQPWTRGP
nr:hypothetical protein [Candidatus Sigynarchaeota archaeon]